MIGINLYIICYLHYKNVYKEQQNFINFVSYKEINLGGFCNLNKYMKQKTLFKPTI